MDELWFFPLFLCIFQIKTLSHYLEVKKKKVRCPKLPYIFDLVGQECYLRKEKNGMCCLNAVPVHKIHRLN